MQTQTKIFIGIGALVLVFIGYGMSQSKDTNQAVNSMVDHSNQDANLKIEAQPQTFVIPSDSDSEAVILETEEDAKVTTTKQAEAGKYLAYSPEAVASSEAENIILSFSATWCPSCRTLDKDINASLSDIPAGTEIYKVDYDTNVELRKKYGVTSQHTQVVVDSDGNLIKKWLGSNTLEQFVAQI